MIIMICWWANIYVCVCVCVCVYLIFIEIQLIYNLVLVSGVQQSDSYIYILFQILFHYKLLQDIEYSSQQKQKTHRHRKQNYGYQKGSGGGINQELGIKICTLLYIRQITNKDLLDVYIFNDINSPIPIGESELIHSFWICIKHLN